MPTYSVQTQISPACGCPTWCRCNHPSAQRPGQLSARPHAKAFTLTEMMVVIVMVSLLATFVVTRLFGLLAKGTFKTQAQELVSAMQMAAGAARQSDRRYEVIIDPVEQGFLLREITTPDLAQILEEEIIIRNSFGDNCRIAYVLFDDGEYTNEIRAKFRAGHSGWTYGGKIVLLDANQKPYSVVISRLGSGITLKEGDVDILMPKDRDDVPF